VEDDGPTKQETLTPGARIAALRRRLGLSQVGLAELLGVSNVTFNRWERVRAQSEPATLERLHRAERQPRPRERARNAGRPAHLGRPCAASFVTDARTRPLHLTVAAAAGGAAAPGDGADTRSIATELGISERSVERHLTAIFGVLGPDWRSATVAAALELGLLGGHNTPALG